jgi:hypothetical protein
MILSAVASPQDRLGDQMKEYARETIGVKNEHRRLRKLYGKVR